MKRFLCLSMLIFVSVTAAPERMYFNFEEMPRDEDEFRIPIGGNIWVQTKAMHRDNTGFYTYVSSIYKEPGSLEYKREWRCPYCNRYWPIGTACQNADCPSRY